MSLCPARDSGAGSLVPGFEGSCAALCATSFSFFLAFLPTVLPAQDFNGKHLDTGSLAMLKSPDAAFLADTAHKAAIQLEAGRVAVRNASNPEVKDLAHDMVASQTALLHELSALARDRHITLPDAFAAPQTSDFPRQPIPSGPAFDESYLSAVATAQGHVADRSKNEAKHGLDDAIQERAAQLAVEAKTNLARAKALLSQMKRAHHTKGPA